MPIVEAHILQGYDRTEKSRLCEALTQAVRFVVPAPLDAITVVLHELPSQNYMRGGSLRTPAPALPDPARIVMDYLRAMEDRDLDKARTFLGDGFKMVFPGTSPMSTLDELIEWAQPRYRFVTKTYDCVEAFQAERTVVYTRGTLSGEWPDGSAFSGIRFIDRFELEGGKIRRQEVWNDIAEVRGQS